MDDLAEDKAPLTNAASMNQTRDLVSIIIPCYKQAQYLPDALDSVLAQTYPHWECVVVNDASPDDTVDIANAYALKDFRIKLLDLKANGGLANARNSGIKVSNGSFILPLDADDKIAPDYLEKSLQYFKDNKNLKVVYTDVQCMGIRHDIVQRPDFNLHQLCHQNLFQPTALFKRQDFDKTDGYRKNVYAYEDWDMWLQLIEHQDQAIRIPEPLFYCRVKESSMITELTGNVDLETRIRRQVWENNRNRLEIWAPELFYQKNYSLTGKIKRRIKEYYRRYFSNGH